MLAGGKHTLMQEDNGPYIFVAPPERCVGADAHIDPLCGQTQFARIVILSIAKDLSPFDIAKILRLAGARSE